MTITFYDPALEKKFRDYVAQTDTSNNALMNALVELVFSFPLEFSDDVVENLEEVSALTKILDWKALKGITRELQAGPLTRSVTLKDVVHGMSCEGIESHRSKGS